MSAAPTTTAPAFSPAQKRDGDTHSSIARISSGDERLTVRGTNRAVHVAVHGDGYASGISLTRAEAVALGHELLKAAGAELPAAASGEAPAAMRPATRGELATLPILPWAVFDEHGDPADDRVQDYGLTCWRAAVAAIRAGIYGEALAAAAAQAAPAAQPLTPEQRSEAFHRWNLSPGSHEYHRMTATQRAEAAFNAGFDAALKAGGATGGATA